MNIPNKELFSVGIKMFKGELKTVASMIHHQDHVINDLKLIVFYMENI